MNANEIIDQIFSIFRERGHRQYGENVTETQHALQCATFARHNDEESVVVAACLLHDYGHLVHDLGEDIAEKGVDAHHETLGANRLKNLFEPIVVESVRLHVAAKRYLCWKVHDYYESLSEASQKSLTLQGGPMTDAEGKQFEQHPFYDIAVRVRKYDDMGKLPDMQTPDFEEFRTDLLPFIKVSVT